MKSATTNKITEMLDVDFKEDDSIWLTNSLTLRKVIGVLGMFLPLLLYVFLYVDSGVKYPLESISHYYYTRVSSIFVVILSMLALFLIIYKGKEPVDFFTSLTAGIFALCVVFFPTGNITNACCDAAAPYSVTKLNESAFREGFHYVSAGIFLVCLAYMSLFLFTKSDKAPSKRGDKKITRNHIYRTCGVLMIVAILVVFAGFLHLIPEPFYTSNHLTFWMETLAVECFGFSWLVKGETLFSDY
ncbi:hypothetical protein [Flavobacterium algicola]|uniref:hypothetical protein n=1 Tax=Flavobacterium algicola TaxID=556529 RepID=UPI001EFD4382|nr:hypothetical protein [Flavobacterium algicola]MCG9792459.1 hypothetical protein [Flavobacterium algicola]